jgi:putative ABC transport system substrate-binding protein
MNRRESIAALLALGAMAGSPGARAQAQAPSQRRTLGVLSALSPQDMERFWLGRLRADLKALGWVEKQNLAIEGAYADYRLERLPALAEDLVRKRVDVIWAASGAATLAAARATGTVPIVFLGVPWPVETGLIESFARPGRNATGVSSYTGIEVSAKRLEFLREIAPHATRLSWILDPLSEVTVAGGRFDVRPLLDPAARSLGYDVRYHYLHKAEGIDAVLVEILDWRAQAMMVAGSPSIFSVRERIAAFALQHRLPSATVMAALVDAGGLLSYFSATGLTENITRSAEYVDRIFRGARAADLPVQRPSTYELVLNLKTASALGLKVPRPLLLRADRVVQ